jgi:hypothetical protein
MSCAVLIAFVVFTLAWNVVSARKTIPECYLQRRQAFTFYRILPFKLMAQRSERLPVGEYEEVKYKNGGDNVSRSFS